MSTATLAIPTPAPVQERFRSVWIISRREDMTWFIGSALAGYLAIALMWAGFPLLPLQAVWFFGVDGPHVLATVTRTYFDKAERKKLGWFLWILAPLLLVGPVAAMTGHAALFFLAAFIWQQFHVVKQHFGFVMLYKAKNRERYDIDRKLDRWFLLGVTVRALGIIYPKDAALVARLLHVCGNPVRWNRGRVRRADRSLADPASHQVARQRADELAQAGFAGRGGAATMAGARVRSKVRHGGRVAGRHSAGPVPWPAIPSPDVVPQPQSLLGSRCSGAQTGSPRA